MTNISDLMQQKQALDAQIAAAKPLAVAQVLELMKALGVTWADMGVAPITAAAPAAKRAVKYRDEQGNTWTGVGQRPRWLRARLAAGASVEDFRVKG